MAAAAAGYPAQKSEADTSTMPQGFYERLLEQVAADPGLPSANPTVSGWQLPPHQTLAYIQSPQLPKTTDYAIIGSGITGCSIAKNLLEHSKLPENATVTVFEARTITSGASGRNGGGLATYIPYTFDSMCKQFGQETAIEIARFMFRTLEKMFKMGASSEELLTASEIRRTRDVTGFLDQASFEAIKEQFKQVEELIPEASLRPEFLTPETAKKVEVLLFSKR